MDKQNTSIPHLSIIIPAYNEQDRIISTLKEVFSYIHQRNLKAEVIVVDDGSIDQTIPRIREHFPATTNLVIHSLPKNKGKGYAVRMGMMASQGQYILFMDADSSTPINEFPKLEQHITNFDIVIGSRIKDPTSDHDMKKPWYRKVITKIGKKIIQALLISNIQDTQCGFKLFRRDVAKMLAKHQTIDRFGFDVELLLLAQSFNYSIKEVPVLWQHSNGSRFHPFWDTLKTGGEILKIKAQTISRRIRS